MSTLIHVSNSEGTVGRCDARCYGAVCSDCQCICGGMNHGAGRDAAIENTRAMAADQVSAIEAQGGFVAAEVRQAVLL